MIRARVERGQIKVEEPIPPEWEGQSVTIQMPTPEDPLPDLETRLALIHSLGPMEYDPGEKESIAAALAELNETSRQELNSLTGRHH